MARVGESSQGARRGGTPQPGARRRAVRLGRPHRRGPVAQGPGGRACSTCWGRRWSLGLITKEGLRVGSQWQRTP